MAELKAREGGLTTADLASYGIRPRQLDGPKLVKGELETLDRAAAVSEPMPLFSESEMGDFRSQWSELQTGFVGAAPDGRRCRQACSFGNATTCGRIRQRAIRLGKAVGPRRQRVH